MAEIRRASLWEIRLSQSFGALRLKSLRDRMVAFAVLAALLPSLVTAIVSYRQNRRSLNTRIEEELQNSATQASREVMAWYQGRIFDLKVFAASYEITENLARADARLRVRAYLQSVMGRVEHLDELLVVDLQGRTLASNLDSAGAIQLPEGWLQDVRLGREVMGAPQLGPSGASVMLAVPVNRPGMAGTTDAALVARLRLDGLTAELSPYAPTLGAISVLDRTGTLITRVGSDDADSLGSSLDAPALEALFADTLAVQSFHNAQGIRAVGTLRTVRTLPWIVVAELTQSVAFDHARRLRNTTILMVLVILLGVGWIGYRLGLLIVRPLDRLRIGAEKVASGDLTVDLPVVGSGEVAYLTEVFNDMVSRLRENQEQIAKAHAALQEKNAELERLSVTDQLTGLYNRRRLMEVLASEIQRSKRHEHAFSLLMMDVDHFKKFNDSLGHLAGDRVLAGVAEVLGEATRDIDTASRYGGEEFVVVLPETDLDEAVEVAERIRSSLAARIFEGRRVTLSVGAAEFPRHGDDVQPLIAAADAALYRAKEGGRNRVMRAEVAA